MPMIPENNESITEEPVIDGKYVPTIWKDGDLVTSEKLNNIEQGIVSSHDKLYTIFDNDKVTLSKTWQEILDNEYTTIYSIEGDEEIYIQIQQIDSDYTILVQDNGNSYRFVAENANDYPIISSKTM